MQTLVEKDLFYFIERTKEHLEIIEGEILNLSEVTYQPERILEIFRRAHSIKENAAFLGIDFVQKAFHYLEDALQILLESQIEVDRQLISLFLKSYDLISFLIARLENYNTLDARTFVPIISVIERNFAKLFDCLQQKLVMARINISSLPCCSKTVSLQSKKEGCNKQNIANRTFVPIQKRRQINIIQIAQKASKEIFELSKQFPIEEYYTLTNPLRYSSRLVCVYCTAAIKSSARSEFIDLLNRAKVEIAKTQTWLELAVSCNYIKLENAKIILQNYDLILSCIDRCERTK